MEEFEQESGVKVEVVAEGTGALLQRLESEQEHPQADIFWGGSLSTMKPKAALFEEYRSVNEDHVQEAFKNKEGSITRFTDIPSVIMINTNLIGDVKVEGYEDLLNPALKGRIKVGGEVGGHYHDALYVLHLFQKDVLQRVHHLLNAVLHFLNAF